MTPRTSRTYNQELEKAIKFLVFRMHETGHNPKPVILHSIQMATHLDDLGYGKEIVVAALLHDLIEDSDTKIGEIEKEFSGKVANLVRALTFDRTLPQGERFYEYLKRMIEEGLDALVISAADFLDNSKYYHLGEDEELKKWLYEKRQTFVEKSEPILKNEPIWKELRGQKI